MKVLKSNLICPSCGDQMKPKVLSCEGCEIELRGHFEHLEFSQLSADELHFVRLFIHCEGRIRDLEKSLGVSYPTVKLKIAKIKSKLSSVTDSMASCKLSPEKNEASGNRKNPTKPLDEQIEKIVKESVSNPDQCVKSNPKDILDNLSSGKLTYQDALIELQQL